MKQFILITGLLISFFTSAQKTKRKFRPLLWTTHSKNTNIFGMSVGILPKDIFKDTTLTKTFGIRIEAPGLGVLLPLIPKSPISKDEDTFQKALLANPSEIVYGINISSGSVANTQVNGISGAFIGQYLIKMNGISGAIVGNLIERQNGITASIFSNDSYKTNGIMICAIGNKAIHLNGIQISAMNETSNLNGIQIGLWNKTKNSKGVQIGLWNKNEKRSLPIVNWNF